MGEGHFRLCGYIHPRDQLIHHNSQNIFQDFGGLAGTREDLASKEATRKEIARESRKREEGREEAPRNRTIEVSEAFVPSQRSSVVE